MLRALSVALLAASVAGAETHRLKPTRRPSHLRRARARPHRQAGRRAGEREPVGRVVREGGRKWPGEVGPIAIEGAEPGDTPRGRDPEGPPQPRHRGLDPGRPLRRAGARPGTAMLNEEFPRGRYVWRLDRERMTGTRGPAGQRDEVRHRPAAADAGPGGGRPEGEMSFDGLWPGPFGGNLDDSDVREGTTHVPARLPSRRALLLRRRPRPAGRRRGVRLRPRDVDGRRLPLRPPEEEGHRVAAASRTPST